MTRSLKSAGPLTLALLALGAMMATTASAHVAARFTYGQANTAVFGKWDELGTGRFKVTSSEIECGVEEFSGSSSVAVAETMNIKPTLTECTAFGFAEAKVTGFGHYGEAEANRCVFIPRADVKMDFVCPIGRDWTVEVSGVCTIHVPSQVGLGTVTYTTGNKVVGSEVKHDLTLDVNLTGITVTHTHDGFLCPFASGESSVATYTAKWTYWAQDPTTGKLVDLTWDATVA